MKIPGRTGLDVCGLVTKLGSKVDPKQFTVGKTIVFYHGNLFRTNTIGSFAEYHLHDSRYLAIVPENLLKQHEKDLPKLYCDLASLPCAGFTAHELVCCKLKLPIFKEDNTCMSSNVFKKKNVFVTAAAGGVGGFCVQLLRLWRNTFKP